MRKYIDHTILKADATLDDVKELCEEAIEYNFKAVCVNPSNVSYAQSLLKDTDVLVCSVVGFPLGSNTTKVKVFETLDLIENGADEIDMVINIGRFLAHDYDYVLNEIKEVRQACLDKTMKVIIETSYLSDAEIVKISEMCVEANVDFVKTSTGFSSDGAKLEDVKLIKQTVGDKALIKASGGIRSKEDLEAMIKAGASRIGTSSGTKIT